MVDLEPSLEALRAYRKSGPNFERAIADYVDAEALLKEDPAEGQRAEDLGPAQKSPQDPARQRNSSTDIKDCKDDKDSKM